MESRLAIDDDRQYAAAIDFNLTKPVPDIISVSPWDNRWNLATIDIIWHPVKSHTVTVYDSAERARKKVKQLKRVTERTLRQRVIGSVVQETIREIIG